MTMCCVLRLFFVFLVSMCQEACAAWNTRLTPLVLALVDSGGHYGRME
jgi:hypothetical protein